MQHLIRHRFIASVGMCVATAITIASGQVPATRTLSRVPAPVGPGGATSDLYAASYALLVGVSVYDDGAAWPRLETVPQELDQLADTLRAGGFDGVERIVNPTGAQLRRGVEEFIRKYGYTPGNRLVFFFSGHGFTLDGGERGYFVPRDAPDPQDDEPGFRFTALSMQQVATWAQDVVARHAMFVFDSCFSGTIFRTRDRILPQRISELTARPVREFLSAGGAGEPVPARSVFTPSFIRAIRGEADLDKDGFVTGTEIGNFVQREVIAYRTRQTPQFGKIRDPRYDEGDMVFAVPTAPRPATSPTVDPSRALSPACWQYVVLQKAVNETNLGKQLQKESLSDDAKQERFSAAVTKVLAQRATGAGVFSGPDSGLVAADPTLDATANLIAVMNGSSAGFASPRPCTIAFVVLQTIANETRTGKAATQQIQDLQQRKTKELNAIAVARGGSSAEATKFKSEAEAEINGLQERLRGDFEKKVQPALETYRNAAGVALIFNGPDSGLVFADPRLDVTRAIVDVVDGLPARAIPKAPLARIGYVTLQRVANESLLGRRLAAEVQEATNTNPSSAKDVQSQKQTEFERVVRPVIEQVARAQGYTMVFNATDAGMLAADPDIDLTQAVINQLDKTVK